MNTQKEVRQAAIESLRVLCPEGTTLYTILRHRSRSGMQRHVSVLIVRDGKPVEISYLVARACGYRRHPVDGGLIVNGAGFDAGTELAHNLTFALTGKQGSIYSTEIL